MVENLIRETIKIEKRESYSKGLLTGIITTGIAGLALVGAYFVPINFELRDFNKDGRDDLIEYRIASRSVYINDMGRFRLINTYHSEKDFEDKINSDLKKIQSKIDEEGYQKQAEARRKVQEMKEKGLIELK